MCQAIEKGLNPFPNMQSLEFIFICPFDLPRSITQHA